MGRAAGFSKPSPLPHPLLSHLLTARINPPKFDWNSWEHASCIAQGLSVASDCFLPFSLPFPLQYWFKQLSLSGLKAEREVLNDTIIYLVMLKKSAKPLHCRYQCGVSLFPPSASSKGFAMLIPAPVSAWDSEKKRAGGGGRTSPKCFSLS